MSLAEHFSTINLINNDDFGNENNINDIHKIESIIRGLETNSFKNIIVKNEIECFYSQINNCSPKERLVITTLINISKTSKRIKNSEYLSYNDIFPPNISTFSTKENDIDDIDNKIFDAVSRVAHKTLHKSEIIEGKTIKKCEIFNKDLNDKEFNENNNRDYNNIDKLINNKKEKDDFIEFIAIKGIIIAMINLTEELINNNYLEKSENITINMANKEYIISEEEENTIIFFKPYLFESIYNDYIYTSNMCPFLENYFIDSFNNFRQKYQISFTLTELFTDIFWNCIFHNKVLCKKFINIYIGNDIVCENIRIALNKIIKIIRDISIPIKTKLFDLLNLTHIENKDDIDLMTSIAKQKNINHELSKNENIINNVNKTSINREYMNIINSNDNENEEENNDNKNNKRNNSKNKNKLENTINEDNLENKSLDEVYNYINNNMENKNKKKKRTKKKKNKKMENEMKAFNEEKNTTNDEDQIVLDFKKDIEQDVINANDINKVKPVVSENWLKKISEY